MFCAGGSLQYYSNDYAVQSGYGQFPSYPYPEELEYRSDERRLHPDQTGLTGSFQRRRTLPGTQGLERRMKGIHTLQEINVNSIEFQNVQLVNKVILESRKQLASSYRNSDYNITIANLQSIFG